MDPREHWKGMPEFEQRDLRPMRKIIVNFASAEDFAKFATLLGQEIGPKVKSVWYPAAEIGRYANLRYVNVSDDAT